MAEASGKPAARTRVQFLGLVLGPAVAVALLLLVDLVPGKPQVTRMGSVAALMAVWWVTEAIPLAATALMPLLLFPLLGIMAGKVVAPVYVNSTIFLFIGGFMIALAMERWNLHKRVALLTIKLVGGGPSRIVLGFMLASGLLSMWISNTATAVMMLPIGMSIIQRMEQDFDERQTHPFSVALMLGIAYGSSMGGMATLVGTPPNLVLQRVFAQTFAGAPPIAFGAWMLMALPIAVVMMAAIWLLLTRLVYRSPPELRVDRAIVRHEHRALGATSFEEQVVLAVFVTTALLWIFRADLRLGSLTVPGWSRLMPFAALIDDGTVALAMASLLFFVPTRSAGAGQPTVMGGDVFVRLPWDVVLLFGGGFALAQGFAATGLSAYIGQRLEGLAGVSPMLVITVVCFTLTFLTELTSNTATTQMILPILAAVASAMRVHPLLLMIPATLSASCAFMMPVATPPNAIVFGSGRVRIGEMVKVGVLINLIGVVLIATVFYFLGTAVFGIDPSIQPAWAAPR